VRGQQSAKKIGEKKKPVLKIPIGRQLREPNIYMAQNKRKVLRVWTADKLPRPYERCASGVDASSTKCSRYAYAVQKLHETAILRRALSFPETSSDCLLARRK